MNKPLIYVDTREQKAYSFKGLPTKLVTLKVGDYSLHGHSIAGITIERKSFNDLFNTLSKKKNLERFKRELARMQTFKVKALVMECSMDDVARGHPKTQMNGFRTLELIFQICADSGVLTLFCGNRRMAEKVTRMFLTMFHRCSR